MLERGWRVAVAGGRWPAASGPLGSRRRDVLGVRRGGGLDLHDVGDLAVVQALTERCDLAIAGVGADQRRPQPSLGQLVDHVQRQPPLLAVTDRVGHVRLAPALDVLIPRLGQEDPPIKRTRRLIAGGVDRHPDLAVVDPPQRTRVLAADPDRETALSSRTPCRR
jgi:hypothetical protein